MASLSGNITPQNIVDRFADYVTAAARSGVEWAGNSSPFPEFSVDQFSGTTTDPINLAINGTNIANSGLVITAANIYNTLVSETKRYTRIRQVRARRFVQGAGGNTGSRPNAGFDFDRVSIAVMNDAYLQDIGTPFNPWVVTDQPMTAGGLEELYNSLRASYNAARANTVTLDSSVCHSSCHSSCHGSRGRR